jgi:hypothetical protein
VKFFFYIATPFIEKSEPKEEGITASFDWDAVKFQK